MDYSNFVGWMAKIVVDEIKLGGAGWWLNDAQLS
jgi:hypothetical protein